MYEIGSALSLFLLMNYADEFRAVAEGKSPIVPPVTQDESVAAVAEDIEETTRDFVLKKLAQELKGHPFAEFVAHLLNTMRGRSRPRNGEGSYQPSNYRRQENSTLTWNPSRGTEMPDFNMDLTSGSPYKSQGEATPMLNLMNQDPAVSSRRTSVQGKPAQRGGAE